MGLFDGLDIASAQDDPFKVEDGTYHAVVSSIKAGPTQKGDKDGILFEYTIQDETSPMNGRLVTEWKEIPRVVGEPTPEQARATSFLKQRLSNLGIPESRMNDVDEADLVGIECVVSVKNKGEYTNVVKVALPSDAPAGSVTFG